MMRRLRDNRARELLIAQGGETVGGPAQTRLNPTIGQLIKNYNKIKY